MTATAVMVGSHFDANAWAGTWPFESGEAFPLNAVIPGLREAGFSGALVSPLRAALAAEPSAANAELCDEVMRLPTSGFALRIAPVIDPSLADWERQLAHALDRGGDALGAIRVIPNYHAYDLASPSVDALANVLSAQRIPLVIQVRMLDERAHHPRMVVPPVLVESIAELGRRHPDLEIVVSGVFFGELAALQDVPNVSIELSSVESADTLPDVMRMIPAKRILLGTHAPLYVPAAALAKLAGDSISPQTLIGIGGETARALFVRSRPGTSP
ncbi:MAG: amidohydrolase family protein [Thermomicrobiales bacterium]